MNSIRNLKCSHKHKVTTFSQLNKEANGDNVTQTIFHMGNKKCCKAYKITTTTKHNWHPKLLWSTKKVKTRNILRRSHFLQFSIVTLSLPLSQITLYKQWSGEERGWALILNRLFTTFFLQASALFILFHLKPLLRSQINK